MGGPRNTGATQHRFHNSHAGFTGKGSTDMAMKAPPLQLSLIHGFEVHCGDDAVPVVPSAQRLVAFVALQDRSVRRLTASGVLWGDVTEQRANSCLRSALWRTPAPNGRPLLEATSSHLRLNPEVQVDFRQLVSRTVSLLASSELDPVVEGLGSQLRELGGDLLPDWYDDWVLVERERYRQLRLHALELICERLTDARQYALALEAGLAAVACEPLRESAQRQVVRSHLMEGNVAEALRQYRSYADLLSRELGTGPSPMMERLIASVAGGRHPADGRAVVTAG